MSKFKVGDRVVVARPMGGNVHPYFPIGFEFVVRDTDRTGVYAEDRGYANDERLELVGSIKTPHKHAALIKAWADGAEIQVRSDVSVWMDVAEPTWQEFWHYRVKPEPKPDEVQYIRALASEYSVHGVIELRHPSHCTRKKTGQDNIKCTFDGETGKLKAVELIS